MAANVNGQYGKIIEQARVAPAQERPILLKKLASLAAQDDPFTVANVARELAHYELCTATEFKKAVSTAASKGKRSKAPKPTDDELARLWIESHPYTAYGSGQWRRYDTGKWPDIPADKIKGEVLDILQATKEIGIKPTSALVSSVMELSRIGVVIDGQLWDSDPDILVCKNGALHIPTKELRIHRPEYYMTSGVPFDYDPMADCPVFRQALETTVPEAAPFIQEYAGYCLTTETKHELALWMYGPRGSGKSTIIEGIRSALGDQRCGLLSLSDIERSRFALTTLPGKTLMIGTEQPGMFVSMSGLLNQLISGEPVTIERKFEHPISFTPRAKLLWAMNELPRIADSGDGIFRRVKVVRFPGLSDEQRDPDVKEHIKQEGSGILNWAVEGLTRLRDRGRFEFPEQVVSATEDFKAGNDIELNFMSECCTYDLTNESLRVQSSELYNAYSAWCKTNGHKAKSSTKVSDDWKRLGLVKYAREGKNFWHFCSINTVDLRDVNF
jgi:P4 family phage/plasmid primase-like protien